MDRKYLCLAALMLLALPVINPAADQPAGEFDFSAADVISGMPLSITLADGTELVIANRSLEPFGAHGFEWIGYGDDPVETSLIITVTESQAFGSLRHQDRTYHLKINPGQSNNMTEPDPDSFPLGADPIAYSDVLFATRFEAQGLSKVPSVPNSKAQSTSISPISVMVLYTESAKMEAQAAGQDIEAVIRNAVVDANLSFTETQGEPQTDPVLIQLVLVRVQPIDYTETGYLADLLKVLKDPADGVLDEVGELRDTYAADLVSVFVSQNYSDNAGGKASYIDPNYTFVFPGKAFSAVRWDGSGSPHLAFAHEIGHNLGARHDRYVVNYLIQAAAYVDGLGNFGWVNLGDRWRTLMSYPYECQDAGVVCQKKRSWSNPDLSINGDAAGVPWEEFGAADNRRALNTSRVAASRFRMPALDIDDGTPDGNQRIDAETSEDFLEEDADGNNYVGDGQVDMADFRRWRDWVLLAEGYLTYDLIDGSEEHPKKDVNADEVWESEIDENKYPRGDFNGDARLSSDPEDKMPVPGISLEPVSDLGSLATQFSDYMSTGYDSADLPNLIFSADVTISTACLTGQSKGNTGNTASTVRITFTAPDGTTLLQHTHTQDDPIHVYTGSLEVSGSYTAIAETLDANQNLIGVDERQFDLGDIPGGDFYWTPVCPLSIVSGGIRAKGDADGGWDEGQDISDEFDFEDRGGPGPFSIDAAGAAAVSRSGEVTIGDSMPLEFSLSSSSAADGSVSAGRTPSGGIVVSGNVSASAAALSRNSCDFSEEVDECSNAYAGGQGDASGWTRIEFAQPVTFDFLATPSDFQPLDCGTTEILICIDGIATGKVCESVSGKTASSGSITVRFRASANASAADEPDDDDNPCPSATAAVSGNFTLTVAPVDAVARGPSAD